MAPKPAPKQQFISESVNYAPRRDGQEPPIVAADMEGHMAMSRINKTLSAFTVYYSCIYTFTSDVLNHI